MTNFVPPPTDEIDLGNGFIRKDPVVMMAEWQLLLDSSGKDEMYIKVLKRPAVDPGFRIEVGDVFRISFIMPHSSGIGLYTAWCAHESKHGDYVSFFPKEVELYIDNGRDEMMKRNKQKRFARSYHRRGMELNG